MEGSTCVARDSNSTYTSGPLLEESPALGEAFIYLVDLKGKYSGYGSEAGGREMIVASGESCH